MSARERAADATDRVRRLFAEGGEGKVTLNDIPQGVAVLIDGQFAFAVLNEDARAMRGESARSLAEGAAIVLKQVATETHEARDRRFLAQAAIRAAVATAIWLALMWIARWLWRATAQRLMRAAERHAERLRVGGGEVISRRHAIATVRRGAAVVATVTMLLLTWEWLGYVLGLFPYTRPWSEGLTGFLVGTTLDVLEGIARGLPSMFVALLIFAIAWFVDRALRGFFDRVAEGRIVIRAFDRDTAAPTKRLATIAVWVFAAAMAYPYIPGSDTDAFKGLSVLLGLMRFNFYDVMVMALDQAVIEQQVAEARVRMGRDPGVTTQRRLNFEMSAKNLFQSFADRDRVPKIQGLLNECMTFLDDELSVITGPYDNLLSINEVIDQQLILFVSLNINKNTAPVRALGKMLLQNLQLVVGKRYESESERRRRDKPLFSVVMDEFAPFGYRNFAQILNTARGTNTAFLFSMQSLPQLLQVGKGFLQDVSSAPGTTMLLQTRDEETAKYFKQASSQVPVQKRTQQLWRKDFLGFERFQKTMGATEREQLEFRALDHHIKNLGKGKMEVLMTDPIRGTLHGRLHVRPPSDIRVPCFEPMMFPRLRPSRDDSQGANLRFKDQKLAAMISLPRRGAR